MLHTQLPSGWRGKHGRALLRPGGGRGEQSDHGRTAADQDRPVHADMIGEQADQRRPAQERGVAGSEPTTDTRAAARLSSSPAALIPSGKPSDAPRPQNTAPTSAPTTVGEVTTTRTPATTSSAVTRKVATRPYRSTNQPPTSRPAVMAVTKMPKPTAPTAGTASYPSTRARASQSLATPSQSAKDSTSSPTANVRGSRQAASTDERLSAPVLAPVTGRNDRAAPSPTASTAITVPASCHSSATPARAQPAPTRAPTTVPRLKAAWKRGIMVRPSRRSTSAPSTFMATSQVLLPTP